MKKKSGLGRGIEGILGDYGRKTSKDEGEKSAKSSSSNSDVKTDGEQTLVDVSLQEIACENIQAGMFQARRKFDEDALKELADSIAKHGILQPLVVRPLRDKKNPKYEIIAGERRFRAAQQCGLTSVPCVVRNYDDEQALAASLIENLQRDDLKPLEVADGLQQLVTKFQFSHEQIGKLLGISRASVTNSLRLLNLSEPVKQALEEEKIDKGHAKALLALDNAQQALLLKEIIAKSLTVQQTESKVRALLAGGQDKVSPFFKTPDILDLESKLSEYLGHSVDIAHQRGGRGKIILKYKNLKELDAILEKWGYK